ncbi:sterol desaturase/sphingolipid hydroxylase (fatty acid hydroxylase superfamily) [Zhongshania antarctica]|uniref:Sterol desaturase/sphingolipid hydroxylase (Fatty acid hydroxylase superfamily) n=1 Tax=Zhongshania antarctica TaxID=641702 RepID=A0A840R0N1_9GAMM|nr:sterol desaturase family protein [Zhongshania antarctica]MBB5186188.1 sterol desaturase/sphingolipid hydroxylase (fatty acid hydroxylase superfamily) [Zhongshania antarctica]
MQDVLHALFFVTAFGALFLAIIGAEYLYVRKTGQTGVYHPRETLANLTAGLSYKVVDGIAIALFIQAFYLSVSEWGLQWQPEASVLSIAALIVFIDFCFYVNHVMMHKVRWFWSGHITHHSSEHMNFSTALRQNFTFALSGTWVLWWLPAALVGFDKDWVLLAIEGNLLYQFFLHTEQVGRLGFVEKIMNTPSHHRVHHGSNPEQIDRNFGGIFIFWDKIFNTFRDEADAGVIKYGVTHMPAKPYNPWYLQTHGWVELAQDVWRYKDLRILYKHPEWVDEVYAKKAVKTEWVGEKA